MKKLLALCMALFIMCNNVCASEIAVAVNGETIEFSGTKPFLTDGRAFIPIRGVFERLGYEISWDDATKTATLVSDSKTIKISAYKNHLTIDDNTAVALDLPAQIIDNSMVIPLRAVATAAGIDMKWDHVKRTVFLRSQPGVYISSETMSYGRAYEFLFKCLSVSDYADMLYLSKLKDIYAGENEEEIKLVFEDMYSELQDYRDIIYDFIPTDRNEEGLKAITLRYIDNEMAFIELYESEFTENSTPESKVEEYKTLEQEYRELETLFEEAVSSYHYRIDKFTADYFNTENLTGSQKIALDNYITRLADAARNNIPEITRLDIDVSDILEKPLEYAVKLHNDEEKRNAAFSSIDTPEGFEKRAEILYYADSMLGKMAEVLESYNRGEISYKKAETLIFIYGELYDDFNEDGVDGRFVSIITESPETVIA